MLLAIVNTAAESPKEQIVATTVDRRRKDGAVVIVVENVRPSVESTTQRIAD